MAKKFTLKGPLANLNIGAIILAGFVAISGSFIGFITNFLQKRTSSVSGTNNSGFGFSGKKCKYNVCLKSNSLYDHRTRDRLYLGKALGI